MKSFSSTFLLRFSLLLNIVLGKYVLEATAGYELFRKKIYEGFFNVEKESINFWSNKINFKQPKIQIFKHGIFQNERQLVIEKILKLATFNTFFPNLVIFPLKSETYM